MTPPERLAIVLDYRPPKATRPRSHVHGSAQTAGIALWPCTLQLSLSRRTNNLRQLAIVPRGVLTERREAPLKRTPC